jgi:hypothetical protein
MRREAARAGRGRRRVAVGWEAVGREAVGREERREEGMERPFGSACEE